MINFVEATLPQVFYHGTKATFDMFDEAFADFGNCEIGPGFYFSSMKEEARTYVGNDGWMLGARLSPTKILKNTGRANPRDITDLIDHADPDDIRQFMENWDEDWQKGRVQYEATLREQTPHEAAVQIWFDLYLKARNTPGWMRALVAQGYSGHLRKNSASTIAVMYDVDKIEIVSRERLGEIQETAASLVDQAVEYLLKHEVANYSLLDHIQIDDDNEDESIERLRDYLTEYAYKTVDEIENRIIDGKLTIYREIKAPKQWDWKKETRPHQYWSYDEHAAAAHWGTFHNDHVKWLIKATVSQNDIDWLETLYVGANPSLHDEKEVRLRDSAVVRITDAGLREAWHRQIDESANKYPLKGWVQPSTGKTVDCLEAGHGHHGEVIRYSPWLLGIPESEVEAELPNLEGMSHLEWVTDEGLQQLAFKRGWVRSYYDRNKKDLVLKAKTKKLVLDAAWMFVESMDTVPSRIYFDITGPPWREATSGSFSGASVQAFLDGEKVSAGDRDFGESIGGTDRFSKWWLNIDGTNFGFSEHEGHESYLLDHLEVFDLEIVASEGIDRLLIAAYNDGWIAANYDLLQEQLSLRFAPSVSRGPRLAKALQKICDDREISTCVLETFPDEEHFYILDTDDVNRFIQRGIFRKTFRESMEDPPIGRWNGTHIYHGTSIEHALSIRDHGIDQTKSAGGYFGWGFYCAVDPSLARSNYADFRDEGEEGIVLEFAVTDDANILDMRVEEDFQRWRPYSKKLYDPNLWREMVRNGIDGLYDASFAGLVIYNPKAVRLVGIVPTPDESVSGDGYVPESYNINHSYLIDYLKKAEFDPYAHWWHICEWIEGNGYLEEVSKAIGIEVADADALREEEPDLFYKFPPEIAKKCADDVLHIVMQNEPTEAPTWSHMGALDDKQLHRQTWLVHFTDDPWKIASKGFIYGVDQMDKLGITTWIRNDSWMKKSGGFNFAFQADGRDAERAARSKKYGRDAVLFQSSGVRCHHYGDEEEQVVFYGKDLDPRGIVVLTRDDEGWTVNFRRPDRAGRDSKPFESFDAAVSWVQHNEQQYARLLFNEATLNEGSEFPRKGWVNPKTGQRASVRDFQVTDHGEMLIKDPDFFGILQEDLDWLKAEYDRDDDGYVDFITCQRLLNLATSRGWVRAYYDGIELSLEAASEKLLRDALWMYIDERGYPSYLVYDVGTPSGGKTGGGLRGDSVKAFADGEHLRRLNESLDDWSGRWVHYSKVNKVGINPRSFHQDPAGIYLFPEEFQPIRMWAEMPYRFTIEIDPSAKILDLSDLDDDDLRTIADRAGQQDEFRRIEANYDTTAARLKPLWWKLQEYFGKQHAGSFNSFFRTMGYDAIFDDMKIIHSNEVQMLVLDPTIIEIVEVTQRGGSGFAEMEHIIDEVDEMCSRFGEVTVDRPRKQKKTWSTANLQARLVVESGDKRASFAIRVDDNVPPNMIYVSLEYSTPSLSYGVGASYSIPQKKWYYEGLGSIERDLEKIFAASEVAEGFLVLSRSLIEEGAGHGLRGDGAAVEVERQDRRPRQDRNRRLR